MITAKHEMVVGYAGGERKSMLQLGVKGGEGGTVFAERRTYIQQVKMK
jgi:hypothetical protein